MSLQTNLKLLNIDISYQPFFYVTSNNHFSVDRNGWPNPIKFEKDHNVNTSISDHQIAKYLLVKIIDIAFEVGNINLAKQTIYQRTKSYLKTIEQFNLVLNYLDMLNYVRIQNGGVSGRKKIVVLNPKILDDLRG